MDTRIYICTHKKFFPPAGEMFRPLQVGAALHDDLGYERDDAGDNISDTNPRFCELTGIYYMWKNVQCDIIGLCHYRRYFTKGTQLMQQEDVEEILKDYDVILPHSWITEDGSVRGHYAREHFGKDIDEVGRIIRDICPEYAEAYDDVVNANLNTSFNMIITKKEIFDDYCKWMFSILFELDKRTDISGYDTYQTRMVAFMGERLTRIYMIRHAYRIYESPVPMKDLEDQSEWEEYQKKIGRMHRLAINDLVTVYRSGNRVDVLPFEPNEQMESPPGFVDLLLPKERENWNDPFIKKNAHLRVEREGCIPCDITGDDLSKWIVLPDWILQKRQANAIGDDTWHDLVKATFLYYYGGIWLDPYHIAKEREVIPPREAMYGFLMNAFYFYFLSCEDVEGFSSAKCFTDIFKEEFPEETQWNF